MAVSLDSGPALNKPRRLVRRNRMIMGVQWNGMDVEIFVRKIKEKNGLKVDFFNLEDRVIFTTTGNTRKVKRVKRSIRFHSK